MALESLLHQWDELAQWLRAEASDLRDADAVERAVIGWERSGRHDDWLLDGARLAGAETLSARTGFGARLNPAGEFLLASRRRVNEKLENEKSAAEAHARSLRRRSQVLAALLAVIVVVAAIAGIAFKSAQSAGRRAINEANRATAAKLVAQSRAMLDGAGVGGDRRAIQQMLAAETLDARVGSGVPAEHADRHTAIASDHHGAVERDRCRCQSRWPAYRFRRG